MKAIRQRPTPQGKFPCSVVDKKWRSSYRVAAFGAFSYSADRPPSFYAACRFSYGNRQLSLGQISFRPAWAPARYDPPPYRGPPVSDTLPGFEVYEWNGVFVPHGAPAPIVAKLSKNLNEAIVSSQVTEFAELNLESGRNTPEEFAAFVDAQRALWSRVIREANIKLG